MALPFSSLFGIYICRLSDIPWQKSFESNQKIAQKKPCISAELICAKKLFSVLPVVPHILDIVVIFEEVEHLLKIFGLIVVGNFDVSVLREHFNLG